MQGDKATEGVCQHHCAINAYCVEKCTDEACSEGRRVIGWLTATIVARRVNRIHNLFMR